MVKCDYYDYYKIKYFNENIVNNFIKDISSYRPETFHRSTSDLDFDFSPFYDLSLGGQTFK